MWEIILREVFVIIGRLIFNVLMFFGIRISNKFFLKFLTKERIDDLTNNGIAIIFLYVFNLILFLSAPLMKTLWIAVAPTVLTCMAYVTIGRIKRVSFKDELVFNDAGDAILTRAPVVRKLIASWTNYESAVSYENDQAIVLKPSPVRSILARFAVFIIYTLPMYILFVCAVMLRGNSFHFAVLALAGAIGLMFCFCIYLTATIFIVLGTLFGIPILIYKTKILLLQILAWLWGLIGAVILLLMNAYASDIGRQYMPVADPILRLLPGLPNLVIFARQLVKPFQ
jgi:hypothetical protein